MPELTKIEGISETWSEKLALAGIGSTNTLLEKGATRSGRRDIAETADVTAARVLEWVNRADLFRVKGVGEEYSDLMVACGVDSVPELASRNAGNLCKHMEEVNAAKNLVRKLPVESEVKRWITAAKKLPRLVTH